MHHKTLTALVALLAGVAAWFAWLGWDTTYQTDHATGATSGPYEAWQVVGAVGTLACVAVLASPRLSVLGGALALAVGFAAAWTASAAPGDESGLWAVGAVLVFLSTLAGAASAGGIARAVRRRASHPRPDRVRARTTR